MHNAGSGATATQESYSDAPSLSGALSGVGSEVTSALQSSRRKIVA